MLIKAKDIKNTLEGYSNPACKLQRLVSDGVYHQVIRGLYETDPDTPGILLAGCICSPSYLSFEYALIHYGWMSPRNCPFTCATTGKRHIKTFDTSFGMFTYRDVPDNVFHRGVVMNEENGYTYWIAQPEKALCDFLYSLKPERSFNHLMDRLVEVHGLFRDDLPGMDADSFRDIAARYRCGNVRLLMENLDSL